MKLNEVISKLQKIQEKNRNNKNDLEVSIMDCSWSAVRILDITFDDNGVYIGSDDGEDVEWSRAE